MYRSVAICVFITVRHCMFGNKALTKWGNRASTYVARAICSRDGCELILIPFWSYIIWNKENSTNFIEFYTYHIDVLYAKTRK